MPPWPRICFRLRSVDDENVVTPRAVGTYFAQLAGGLLISAPRRSECSGLARQTINDRHAGACPPARLRHAQDGQSRWALLGDVLDHPGGLERHQVGVADDVAADMDELCRSVCADHLKVLRELLRIRMPQEIGQHGPILRIQAGQQFLEGRGCLLRFEADNPAGFVRPDRRVGADVQVPGSDPGELQCVGQMGLALAQLLLDSPRFPACIGLVKFPLDGGHQPREVPFEK